MFGVSFFELVVIFAIVLIFLGPNQLPEAARKMGRGMAFLKRNSDALRREFYNAVYTPTQEMKQQIDLAARDLVALDLKDPQNMNCEQRARAEEAAAKAKLKEQEEKVAVDQPTTAALASIIPSKQAEPQQDQDSPANKTDGLQDKVSDEQK